jgi:ADP-ribose pyrophosphatase YjhB (NUDIX family)
MPGGSLEHGESLTAAMKREFLEETGVEITVKENIIDFMFPCKWREFTHVHHIAVFYTVVKIGGKLTEPVQFEGQDSLGAVWISDEEATMENASPLVLKAFEWVKTRELDIHVTWHKNWEVRNG